MDPFVAPTDAVRPYVDKLHNTKMAFIGAEAALIKLESKLIARFAQATDGLPKDLAEAVANAKTQFANINRAIAGEQVIHADEQPEKLNS